MKPDEILIQYILGHIRTGDFKLTRHATERMQERGIRRMDIIEAACTSHFEEVQEENKVRFEGLDLDGEQIAVVAVRRSGVIIITVMGD